MRGAEFVRRSPPPDIDPACTEIRITEPPEFGSALLGPIIQRAGAARHFDRCHAAQSRPLSRSGRMLVLGTLRSGTLWHLVHDYAGQRPQ
jgi:hypothetical protein